MLTTKVTSDILLEKYKDYGGEVEGAVFEFEAKLFTSISAREEGERRGEKKFDVSKAHWDNLFTTCLRTGMRSEEQSILTVQFANREFRMRLTAVPGKKELLFETEDKFRLYNYDDPLSWVRYSFSQELARTRNEYRKINPGILKKILLPDLVLDEGELDDYSLRFGEGFQREIHTVVAHYHTDSIKRLARRTSFYPPKFPWARIDMSEILNEKAEIEYDVEIEMLNAKENMQYVDTFYRLCKTLVCSFRGSDNFYNRIVYNAICELINSHCYPLDPKGVIQGNHIYKQIFNQVRTIKKDDLAQGGIVGNDKTPYSVTYKSDGYRAALALTPYGVWLFTIPVTYNLVSKTILFSIDDITIIDGELIPKDKRDESTYEYEYWFEAFDSLYVRGRDIRAASLIERCKILWDYMRAINVEQLFGNKMKIQQKSYLTPTTIGEFFAKNEEMLRYARTLKVRTDGLVFVPTIPAYTIGIEVDADSTERTLSTHNEIVKWKNPEDTTIDLRLRIYEGKRRLLGVEWEVVGDKKNPLEIPFEGDTQFPFDQDTMIDWKQIEEKGVEEGTIGEYGYNFTTKKLEFLRARDVDKQHPNTISAVAIPNWKEIQFPIRENAITGHSFSLMFYYHLRIKREMIEANSKGEFKTLLDIGSGQGGLIWYWSGYERIIACEPNEKHRTEFKRRCAGQKLPVFDAYADVPVGTKRFVILLPYMAQQTEEILAVVNEVTNNKKVDVVSLMDVGTFLWESPEILRAAVQTIQQSMRKGGRFLWKMMSGDIVRQSLPAVVNGKNKYQLGKLFINYEVLDGEVQEKIGIYIPDSITAVGGESEVQEEWLTRTDEFEEMFRETDEYYITYKKRATTEQMMSDHEKTFSSWFEYGVIEKNSPELRENERIVTVPERTRGRGRGGTIASNVRRGGTRGGTIAPRGGRGQVSTGFSRVRTSTATPREKAKEVPRAFLDASGL